MRTDRHAEGNKSLFAIFRMRLGTDNYTDAKIRMIAVCVFCKSEVSAVLTSFESSTQSQKIFKLPGLVGHSL